MRRVINNWDWLESRIDACLNRYERPDPEDELVDYFIQPVIIAMLMPRVTMQQPVQYEAVIDRMNHLGFLDQYGKLTKKAIDYSRIR
ncbi:MAG: hypothetical protein AABX19_03510 [Nanoarchaeota archaeon]